MWQRRSIPYFILNFVFISLLGLQASWGQAGSSARSDQGYVVPVAANEIKVMSYNVENFFNATHEGTHQDWQFLPEDHPMKSRCKEIGHTYYRILCYKTDWTQQRVMVKFHQVATAIQAQGPIPDLMGLQEVESEEVVAYLAEILGYSGYLYYRGPDERGINTALLYHNRNLRLANWDSINVSPSGTRPTRNILRAHFYMNGGDQDDMLAVMVNHWPSQGNPTSYREHIARIVMGEIEKGTRHFSQENYHVLLLGDFNSVVNERPHPLNDYLLNRNWPLFLLDVHNLSDQSRNPMNGIMPNATHFYRTERSWNRMDRIMVSRNFFDSRGVEVIPETFRVVAPSYMTTVHEPSGTPQVPWRYQFDADHPSEAGFSDHFPVIVNIRLR